MSTTHKAGVISLPSDLKTRVASYLGYKDAVRLSSACRAFHADIRLSRLSPPYELIYSQDFFGDPTTGDVPCRGECIPIFSSRPHSIRITCRWKDLGYGSRKGRLYIVAETANSNGKAEESNDDTSDKEAFQDGRVVCESPLVSHEYTGLEFTFVPRKNEIYHMWHRCGCGNILMVEHVVMHTLVFDDQQKSTQIMYSTLSRLNMLGCVEDSGGADMVVGERNQDLVFCTKLLMSVIEMFLDQPNEAQTVSFSILKSFLESNGFQVDRRSLLAVRLVCHFFLQYVDHQTPTCIDNSAISNLQSKTKRETVVPPFCLIPYDSWEGDNEYGNPPIQLTRIPLLHGSTKSLRLTCRYCDPNGKLVVIAKDPADVIEGGFFNCDWAPSDKAGVVWESPIVSDEGQSVEISSVPVDGEAYYLYRKPDGTSEENDFHIENLNAHVTILDDGAGTLARAFKNMQKCAALNRPDEERLFQCRLLLAVADHLLQQKAKKKESHKEVSALVAFLESNGFPIHDQALRSLQEIVRYLVDLNDLWSAFKGSARMRPDDDSDMMFWTHSAM
jgi:exonuclease VII small subunit